MEEEYNQLKGLFDDRPSREDDLRLIQKLQAMLEQREDQLRKAWHELKFFKLELINRENNFNKLFNANPNVGVLNPLEAMTVIFIIISETAAKALIKSSKCNNIDQEIYQVKLRNPSSEIRIINFYNNYLFILYDLNKLQNLYFKYKKKTASE